MRETLGVSDRILQKKPRKGKGKAKAKPEPESDVDLATDEEGLCDDSVRTSEPQQEIKTGGKRRHELIMSDEDVEQQLPEKSESASSSSIFVADCSF